MIVNLDTIWDPIQYYLIVINYIDLKNHYPYIKILYSIKKYYIDNIS